MCPNLRHAVKRFGKASHQSGPLRCTPQYSRTGMECTVLETFINSLAYVESGNMLWALMPATEARSHRGQNRVKTRSNMKSDVVRLARRAGAPTGLHRRYLSEIQMRRNESSECPWRVACHWKPSRPVLQYYYRPASYPFTVRTALP